MEPERWQRVQELFDDALKVDPADREAFLRRECGTDAELRREVESLLRHDGSAGFIAGAVEKAELAEASERPSMVGRRLGNYRILTKLGEGGMGEVYEAEQEHPVRRRVALKLIKPGVADAEGLIRFEAERQALALMSHPAIARVFDAGVAPDGRPFLAMEVVEGAPVIRYCDERCRDTRARLALFIEICRGVQHAHHKGIIHRDLKPSNVLVQEIDGQALPKIIDFGIAKVMARAAEPGEPATRVGVVVGTPEYMSPEQAGLDAADLDTRSDVYALGVLLYELLVGARPFQSADPRSVSFEELRRRIREDVPSRPSTKVRAAGASSVEAARRRGSDVPGLIRQLRGDLDWITMKALEKDRARRYDSPAELAADIQRHLSNLPVLAGPPGPIYRLRKFARRHRVAVAAGFLVVVALAVGALGTLIGYGRAVRAESKARREAESFKRISEFMVELFEVSDPSEARGKEITAREILDRGASRIRSELGSRRDVQATLMDTMGRVYRSLGLYPSAGPLIEDALAIRRGLHGEDDTGVAQSLTSLGALRHAEGRYREAERLLRESLTVLERLGPGHEEQRAETLDPLAECLRMLGEYGKADPITREALEIRRRIFGKEHEKVATSLTRRAVLLRDMGDLDQAESLVREALGMRERLFGELHPDVSAGIQELAFILQEKGDQEAAEPLFRRALDLDRRLYGDDHPDVATAQFNLAALLHNRGKSSEAETLFRRVLEADRRQLGDEHLYVSLSLNNLAGTVAAQGKLDEAESIYRETLAMQQRLVGPEHPEIATTLSNLGGVLRRQGRLREAENTLGEALAMRRKLLGERHPHVAVNLSQLAGALQDQGRLQEAESLHREALKLRLATLGPDHPHTATTMIGLAAVLFDLRRWTESISLYREADRIKRGRLRPGHPDLAHALVGLGRALFRSGESAEAEKHLSEALEIRRSALGPDHWETAEVEGYLGEVFTSAARFEESEPLLLHSRTILLNAFGPADRRAREAVERVNTLEKSRRSPRPE